MHQFHIPAPFDANTTEEYFKNILDMNKENKYFTHQIFSEALKWPLSLCADLAKKRKNLSIQRAIEFSQFANFNTLEIEKMLSLSIKGSISEKMYQETFQNKIFKNYSTTRKKDNQFKDIVYDIKALVIYECLKWARSPSLPENLPQLLTTFNVTEGEINNIFNILKKKKIIKTNHKQLKIIKNDLYLDEFGEFGLKLHQESARSFLNFCSNPQGPALYNFSFLELPRNRFNEISDKLISMRNWLQSIAIETNKKTKAT